VGSFIWRFYFLAPGACAPISRGRGVADLVTGSRGRVVVFADLVTGSRGRVAVFASYFSV
jgi:hypothetical protein